jgi:hypothetical protein
MSKRIAKQGTPGVYAAGRAFEDMAEQLGYHERNYLLMNARWERVTRRQALVLRGLIALNAATLVVAIAYTLAHAMGAL